MSRKIFVFFFLSSLGFLPNGLFGSDFAFSELEDQFERGMFQAKSKQHSDQFVRALRNLYQGNYKESFETLGNLSVFKGRESDQARTLKYYVHGLLNISATYNQQAQNNDFILRYAVRDGVLKEGALRALDSCQKEVNQWLHFKPQHRVLVEVYRSRKDFAHASTLGKELLMKSGVIGIAKFHRIMLITPEALAFGYNWQDALCHEYIHHALKGKAGLALPLWFQEGMARYYETIWRGESYRIKRGDEEALLSAAGGDRLVSFTRMEPSLVYLKDEAEISLAFTQVALAMEQMRERVGPLLDAVARGDNFESAFRRVYGKTLKQFESQLWESWRRQTAQKTRRPASGALRTVLAMDEGKKTNEELYLGPQAQHLLNLGDRLRVKGSSEAALALYRQARELEPLNPYVLSRLARALMALSHRPEAEKTARDLIEANPHWPAGYELMGSFYEDMGLYAEAIAQYDRYFTFNPYHLELYKKIAFLYIDLGETVKALPYLQKARILAPQDQEVARALSALGERPGR